MKLNVKGVPLNIDHPLIGRIVKSHKEVSDQDEIILLSDKPINRQVNKNNILGLLTSQNITESGYENIKSLPTVHSLPYTDHLVDGDIVCINKNGFVNTLYRIDSVHNTLFMTDRCNSNCLMCSQPPKDRDDIDYFFDINMKLISKIPIETETIGITGGEPTLYGNKLVTLLNHLNKCLPETNVHILTNGRAFAWPSFVKKFDAINKSKAVFAVPLYSDYYQSHDYIVQAKDAFYQTIMGIHNLARYGIPIEIRIVLHKQSIYRLEALAEFIYRNMPFVSHVAFMGLEYIGYTPHNDKLLWIDPVEYQEELTKSVFFLASNGMNVSIYNLQFCILKKELWQFARQSISDWKQIYIDECQNCSQLENCGGLFASSIKKHSDYIQAFN